MASNVKSSENQETLDLVLDSSLSLSSEVESGKESGKDVVLDESEREYESMLEEQRRMDAIIIRKRRVREKEELRIKLVAMKSEIEYLDSPINVPAPSFNNSKNGGARPKNRDFNERNGDFTGPRTSPVKYVQLERTVYPSSSRKHVNSVLNSQGKGTKKSFFLYYRSLK